MDPQFLAKPPNEYRLPEESYFNEWVDRHIAELIQEFGERSINFPPTVTIEDFFRGEFEHNRLHYEPNNPSLLRFLPQNGRVETTNICLPNGGSV